jgi:cation diffusion facilitator family transporter
VNRTFRIAVGSLIVGVAVLALKLIAYFVTGSIGLFSDALESVVNVGAAIAVIVAIRLAAKPPDANHPYGHTKAEFFSAVGEGVLIIIAAASILREAYGGLIEPPAIEQPTIGLAISVVATLLNGGWGLYLLVIGRRLHSPALIADGKHLFADVVTSVGVVAGVLLAVATGIAVIDPIVAALVALNVLWSGWKLVRGSVGGLMDEAPPVAEVERIREIISTHAEGAIEAHDLRTRNAGSKTFVEFHLVVIGSMTVNAAHEICDRIERAIREEFPDMHITIHVEPEDKAKHAGIVVMPAGGQG